MTILRCAYLDPSPHALTQHAAGKRIRVLRYDVHGPDALRIGRILSVDQRGWSSTEPGTGYGHRIYGWAVEVELTEDDYQEVERLLADPLPGPVAGTAQPRPEVADVIGRQRATYSA